MKVLGKSIIVRRGETFVLSRKVFKDDGRTPFVLPTSILNPYLVISVTSTAYNVEGRYKCNYWLNLEKYPKFQSSTPIPVKQTDFDAGKLPTGCTDSSNIYVYDGDYYRHITNEGNTFNAQLGDNVLIEKITASEIHYIDSSLVNIPLSVPYEVTPSNATNQDIYIISSDNSIVAVNDDNTITPLFIEV